MMKAGKLKDTSVVKAQNNYHNAVDAGLLRIPSKMGIAPLTSYLGAQIFEAIGIGEAVIDNRLKGTSSRIEQTPALKDIASETVMMRPEDAELTSMAPSIYLLLLMAHTAIKARLTENRSF